MGEGNKNMGAVVAEVGVEGCHSSSFLEHVLSVPDLFLLVYFTGE
jgi:hypothetical protein